MQLNFSQENLHAFVIEDTILANNDEDAEEIFAECKSLHPNQPSCSNASVPKIPLEGFK